MDWFCCGTANNAFTAEKKNKRNLNGSSAKSNIDRKASPPSLTWYLRHTQCTPYSCVGPGRCCSLCPEAPPQPGISPLALQTCSRRHRTVNPNQYEDFKEVLQSRYVIYSNLQRVTHFYKAHKGFLSPYPLWMKKKWSVSWLQSRCSVW